ncbi:YceI family protein [Aurantiacibacter luteus]|nr:YceI family protein [Aurantiacibacter luteus]
MRKIAFAAAASLGIAAAAVSAVSATAPMAPQAGPEAQEVVVTSGTYTADPNHTLVGWSLSHFGFNDYFGLYGNISGTLNLDAENLGNSSLDITIPLDTPTVASAGLAHHLLRPGNAGAAPDFFGPSPEPARFVSTAVHPMGDNQAHIMGNLTFNGQTHPVEITAGLSGAGTNMMNQKATLGFHGTATIMRSQWGLGYGVPMGLGDEVKLNITAAFEK